MVRPCMSSSPRVLHVRVVDCPRVWTRTAGALTALALVSSAVACGGAGAPGGSAEADAGEGSALVQTSFRVRSDTAAPLNADHGWAGARDEPVRVAADRPFRIRFEVAGVGGSEDPTLAPLGLQVRRNHEAWETVLARDFPYPDEISTPRVSVVETRAWADDQATFDLVDGSSAPFAGGAGVSLDSVTAPLAIPQGDFQTEWEWPVVVRRYADGAVTNEAGDTFEFRMVDGEGRPVLTGGADGGGRRASATVTVTVPPGHLGGTYVETPGVLGPWQASDGDLYFPMEPAETFNVLMVVRSQDHGTSWSEVDGENRPLTDDLEGFVTAWHDGRVYILHQISEATYLHAFATEDAPDGRDGWLIRDELVARHSEPPTQVAALVAHRDGRLTAFYADSLGLRSRVRGVAGDWSPERGLDAEPGFVASGVMTVLGSDGQAHVAYTAGNGAAREVWYRVLRSDGTLQSPVRLAVGVGTADEDVGALAPLVHLAESGATVVLYRLADGYLYERTVLSDGTVQPARRVTDRKVVQNASDSEQVGADAVGHAGRVAVAFIDEATRDLWVVRRGSDGVWGEAEPVVEDVNAQWVRGAVVRGRDGQPVYGVVYDAGSDGGSGMNRYVEISLAGR